MCFALLTVLLFAQLVLPSSTPQTNRKTALVAAQKITASEVAQGIQIDSCFFLQTYYAKRRLLNNFQEENS